MTTNNATWPWTWPVTWSAGAPVTAEDHHVDAIIDILSQAEDFALWTPTFPGDATGPSVRAYWDDATSERGPGADQPEILYVWSPTGSTLDRFSMDGDEFRRNDSIEVQIWSLDADRVEQLQHDVTNILSQYLDDNKTDTPYTDVAPVNEEDFREQKPARSTDHFVMSVEVATDGLQDTLKNA